MISVTLNVKVDGEAGVQLKLLRLAQAINEPGVLDEAGAFLLNVMRQRYRAEVNPDNEKWVPSKAAIRESRRTLFDTGRLFHSIQLYATGQNERAIGTDVPYAKYHQNPVSGIKRQFLGFNENDAELTERLLIRRIQRFLKD